MPKKVIIAAAVILALAGVGLYMSGAAPIDAALSAVFGGEKTNQDGKNRSRRPIPVDVANVDTDVAETVFATTGEVVADDRVMLTSEINGRVAEILVNDGATVAVGEPILRFDAASEQAAVTAAEARLSDARRSYERVAQLAERDFAAKASIDEAAAALEQAAADLELARTRLDDQTVRTPFAGEVGLVAVSPGAVLEPGSAIADLATTKDLRARFSIPERYADEVDVGTPLRFSDSSGRTVYGEISVLSPLTDRATRSVKAEAKLNATSGFRPGSFVRVAVILERTANAVFVPETAILYQGLSTALFKVVDGKAVRVAVEIGMRRDGMIEVQSGELAAGDTVIAEGLQKVADGRPVQPRDDNVADPSSTGRAAR